jgi:hypothetical protein
VKWPHAKSLARASFGPNVVIANQSRSATERASVQQPGPALDQFSMTLAEWVGTTIRPVNLRRYRILLAPLDRWPPDNAVMINLTSLAGTLAINLITAPELPMSASICRCAPLNARPRATFADSARDSVDRSFDRLRRRLRQVYQSHTDRADKSE